MAKEEEEFVEGVHKINKKRRTPRAANYDVHRSLGDALDPYMLLRLGQNAVEI